MGLSESYSGEFTESVPARQSLIPLPAPEPTDRLSTALDGLFLVQEVEPINNAKGSGVVFRGTLLGDAEQIYPVLVERFKAMGYTPAMQREGKFDVVIAAEGLVVGRGITSPAWVHGLLLVITIITTIFAGAQFQGYSLDGLLYQLSRNHFGYLATVAQVGAPFAITLLLILGIHEMGHYFAARRHGVDVTLPYFIPLPVIGILGTLGAVIFIKSALASKKALFDVGISGPLAGFVVALLAFIIGLHIAPVQQNIGLRNALQAMGNFKGLGMPLLLQWVGAIVSPADHNLGYNITYHPVALAAWFGMLLTVLNLLPIGQLDGGHVIYTLFGRFAWTISIAAFIGLMFLGLTVFPSFIIYGLLALLTGLRHPPPGNDITPLDTRRRVLGYATIVLFFLLLTTTPFVFSGR